MFAFSLPIFNILFIASVSFLNSFIFFPIGTISLIKRSLSLFFNSEKFLILYLTLIRLALDIQIFGYDEL